MLSLSLDLPDVAATERFGKLLAVELPAGVVALSGTLGAGKTRLVQAIAAALEVNDEVVSPTFVLCREYHGRRTIYHLDAYRLRDDDEFLELGIHELFETDVLIFIEWAERVERCLPDERIAIALDVTGETERRATITSPDSAWLAQVGGAWNAV
jgi:tRNA threonylcarbamoyladenosine biosynthesis protein TsaE